MLFLTTREMVVAGRDSSVLRMKLLGANRQARIEGLDRLPGISNYFLGNDPAKWQTGVPNYGRVALREVYPGIDLVLYSTFLGGLTGAQVMGIAVDGAGNAYVAGAARSIDFPTVNPLQARYSDSFVAKISPDGSKLLYSTFLGGNNGGDQSFAIAARPRW